MTPPVLEMHVRETKLPATCWCESTTVMVPVHWISEGYTGSCGSGCGPGCPVAATDAFDDSAEVATTGKKVKMKRFDAAKYDPRADSSYGYASSETRKLHPDDLILEVKGDDVHLCACGCGEPPKGKHAVFGMGHDARLRGKLSRAQAAQARIVLTDQSHTTREVVSPTDYAARFSTDKLDWVASVQESAARARKSDGADQTDRQIVERALGPQVGETKLIKVGRWEKTGRILAIYEDGQGILFEYADAAGGLRHARQDADGKIHEVKEPLAS